MKTVHIIVMGQFLSVSLFNNGTIFLFYFILFFVNYPYLWSSFGHLILLIWSDDCCVAVYHFRLKQQIIV